MRIDQSQETGALNKKQVSNSTVTEPKISNSEGFLGKKVSISDEISISTRAATVRQYVSRVSEEQDIRQDKVNSFKSLIQSGNYHPNTEDLAEALLG